MMRIQDGLAVQSRVLSGPREKLSTPDQAMLTERTQPTTRDSRIYEVTVNALEIGPKAATDTREISRSLYEGRQNRDQAMLAWSATEYMDTQKRVAQTYFTAFGFWDERSLVSAEKYIKGEISMREAELGVASYDRSGHSTSLIHASLNAAWITAKYDLDEESFKAVRENFLYPREHPIRELRDSEGNPLFEIELIQKDIQILRQRVDLELRMASARPIERRDLATRLESLPSQLSRRPSNVKRDRVILPSAKKTFEEWTRLERPLSMETVNGWLDTLNDRSGGSPSSRVDKIRNEAAPYGIEFAAALDKLAFDLTKSYTSWDDVRAGVFFVKQYLRDQESRLHTSARKTDRAMLARPVRDLLDSTRDRFERMTTFLSTGDLDSVDRELTAARVNLRGTESGKPSLFAIKALDREPVELNTTSMSEAEIRSAISPYLKSGITLTSQDIQSIKERKPFVVNTKQEGDRLGEIYDAALKAGLLGVQYVATNIKRFSPDSHLAEIDFLQRVTNEYNGNLVVLLSVEQSDSVLLGDGAGMSTMMQAIREKFGDDFLKTANINLITDGGLKTRGGNWTGVKGYNGAMPTPYGVEYYKRAINTLGKVRLQHADFGEKRIYWTASDGDYDIGGLTYGQHSQRDLQDDNSWSMIIHGKEEKVFDSADRDYVFDQVETALRETGQDIRNVQDMKAVDTYLKNKAKSDDRLKRVMQSIDDKKLTSLGENFSNPVTGRLSMFQEKPSAGELLVMLLRDNERSNKVIPNAFLVVYTREAFLNQLDVYNQEFTTRDKTGREVTMRLGELGGSYFEAAVASQFNPRILDVKYRDAKSLFTRLHETLPKEKIIAAGLGTAGRFTDRGNTDLLGRAYFEALDSVKIEVPEGVTRENVQEGNDVSLNVGEGGRLILKNVRIGDNVTIEVKPGATVKLEDVDVTSDLSAAKLKLGDKVYIQRSQVALKQQELVLQDRTAIIDSKLKGAVKIQGGNAVLLGVDFTANQTFDLNQDGNWRPTQELEIYSGETMVSILNRDGERYVNRTPTDQPYKDKSVAQIVQDLGGLEEAQRRHPRIFGVQGVSSAEVIANPKLDLLTMRNWMGPNGEHLDITSAKRHMDYLSTIRNVPSVDRAMLVKSYTANQFVAAVEAGKIDRTAGIEIQTKQGETIQLSRGFRFVDFDGKEWDRSKSSFPTRIEGSGQSFVTSGIRSIRTRVPEPASVDRAMLTRYEYNLPADVHRFDEKSARSGSDLAKKFLVATERGSVSDALKALSATPATLGERDAFIARELALRGPVQISSALRSLQNELGDLDVSKLTGEGVIRALYQAGAIQESADSKVKKPDFSKMLKPSDRAMLATITTRKVTIGSELAGKRSHTIESLREGDEVTFTPENAQYKVRVTDDGELEFRQIYPETIQRPKVVPFGEYFSVGDGTQGTRESLSWVTPGDISNLSPEQFRFIADHDDKGRITLTVEDFKSNSFPASPRDKRPIVKTTTIEYSQPSLRIERREEFDKLYEAREVRPGDTLQAWTSDNRPISGKITGFNPESREVELDGTKYFLVDLSKISVFLEGLATRREMKPQSTKFDDAVRPSVPDRAMLSTTEKREIAPLLRDQRNVGGINLNPELLDLQIRRDGNGVPLPINQQPIQNMRIEGFLPVIINIQPIPNLPLMLGIAPADHPEGISSAPADPAVKEERVSVPVDDKVSLLN